MKTFKLSTIKSIKIYAPIFDLSELGEAARNLVRHLKNRNIPISIGIDPVKGAPISQGLLAPEQEIKRFNTEFGTLIDKKIKYKSVLYLATPDYAYSLKLFEKNKSDILCTYHHLREYPEYWLTFLKHFDLILVPGVWNFYNLKETMSTHNTGVNTEVAVLNLPLGKINTNLNKQKLREQYFDETARDGFVFYSVVSDNRCNLEGLLRSYWSEFHHSEPVALLLGLNYPQDRIDNIQKFITYLPRESGPRCCSDVMRINILQPEAMSILHAIGDCYVSLSHADGLGYHKKVASSVYDNLVIYNQFGESIENNTDLVYDYSLMPVSGVEDINLFNNTQMWANPNYDQVRHFLRSTFELRNGE